MLKLVGIICKFANKLDNKKIECRTMLGYRVTGNRNCDARKRLVFRWVYKATRKGYAGYKQKGAHCIRDN